MRYLFYVILFIMGLVTGLLLSHRYYGKKMQELKDHPPECIIVETYYL
jgi:uncharacterized protein YneF (UPF0154 family)